MVGFFYRRRQKKWVLNTAATFEENSLTVKTKKKLPRPIYFIFSDKYDQKLKLALNSVNPFYLAKERKQKKKTPKSRIQRNITKTGLDDSKSHHHGNIVSKKTKCDEQKSHSILVILYFLPKIRDLFFSVGSYFIQSLAVCLQS